jgi:hypothetical protein
MPATVGSSGVGIARRRTSGRICGRSAGVQPRGYHGLRRAAASYIAAAGGLSEAAAALGHASASTTQAHYVDQTIAKPTRSHLDMLPHLDLGQEPPDPVADAKESALRAGRAAGRDLAARGEPCPARASIDALASSAGVPPEMVAHYRQGLVSGWADGQEDQPGEPAA